MSADDDAALIRQIQAGSERAFNTLIERHQQAVRQFLRRLLADPSEAEDLAQEAFLAVARNPGAYDGRSGVQSWICAIAWRKAKSSWRSVLRRRRREAVYDADIAPAASGLSREDALAAHQALQALPLEQRAAVALCLGGEFSHVEAAEMLGLPLGTVKSHVARGRAKLLEALGGPDGR